MEGKDRAGEDILLEIEPSDMRRSTRASLWSISKNSGNVGTVPVVHDHYHSKDQPFERIESGNGEAVSGYIMALPEEIMHGLPDRDLGGRLSGEGGVRGRSIHGPRARARGRPRGLGA